jgi:hypothetical protein
VIVKLRIFTSENGKRALLCLRSNANQNLTSVLWGTYVGRYLPTAVPGEHVLFLNHRLRSEVYRIYNGFLLRRISQNEINLRTCIYVFLRTLFDSFPMLCLNLATPLIESLPKTVSFGEGCTQSHRDHNK